MVGNHAARRLVACFAVAAVLALAWLPSEHAHFTWTDDGHHSGVIHRHYEPHHPAEGGTSVGDDEDHQAQWLESPFIGPQPVSHGYPVSQILHVDLPSLQPQPASWWVAPFVAVSIHDPPWATSHGPRAPPALSV